VRTHPRILVRLNEREVSYRDNDFPCEDNPDFNCQDPDGAYNPAAESLERESWTTNTQNAGTTRITQNETSSTASSRTTTRSEVILNLRTNEGAGRGECGADSGVLCSNITTNANAGWSH